VVDENRRSATYSGGRWCRRLWWSVVSTAVVVGGVEDVEEVEEEDGVIMVIFHIPISMDFEIPPSLEGIQNPITGGFQSHI